MADILKVSTPLLDRVPQNTARPVVDPSAPFDLADVTRVVQTTDPTEILQQNTGYIPKENESPSILADLLRDPSVTASVIRSISMLQEVISLLPANNTALTQEVEQLFQDLMLSPEQIVSELQNQEQGTTLFKGDLFDQLRTLLSQAKTEMAQATGNTGAPNPRLAAGGAHPAVGDARLANTPQQPGVPGGAAQAQAQAQAQPGVLTTAQQLRQAILNPPVAAQAQAAPGAETATGVGVLLKALNATIARRDVLESVANNLTYLANNVQTSPTLFQKLESLITAFRAPSAPENFPELKQDAMAVLQDVENSILFTPQMEKVVPLVVYNLSRYNDNDDFLPDALRMLLSSMPENANKEELVENLQRFIDKFEPTEGARAARAGEDDGQVMNALSKIIQKQADVEDLQLLSGDKLERIVHSMLSSPSNFTPLMHFVLPVEFEDVRAFAEIWMEQADEDGQASSKGGAKDGSHMLMVFDVDGVGRFENDMYITGKKISMNLSCPPAYTEAFKNIGPAIRRAIAGTGYTFEAINVDKLTRNHSLMDVFKDLPHRRTGIDVKV